MTILLWKTTFWWKPKFNEKYIKCTYLFLSLPYSIYVSMYYSLFYYWNFILPYTWLIIVYFFLIYIRYSDSSQYDNVPTRIAPGILKYNRDRFHNVSRGFGTERHRDEIEALEEWVGVLRKSTTGTQTKNMPSSPTDPGYVRHTANNWPREMKSKTSGSSPDEIH